jgi:NTE family protein
MTNVAIACQGGGSHTAFTAGVLQYAFEHWDESDDLVGLSGTSGGALNAVAAWYGLVTGDRQRAADVLEAVWEDVAADTPLDRTTNAAALWTRRIETSGFPTPSVSPYFLPASAWGRAELRDLVERHVDFDAIRELGDDPSRPELVVGTVDVEGGVFETFTNREVTADAVLASAAVPTLFRAVEIHGHAHWDGLFSQNPPVNDLVTVPEERQPDELWVVQINPQQREGEPTSLAEISDRRNELAGNISLNQELGFIERVNDWLEAGHLSGDRFTKTEIHRLELADDLHHATKVDRSPAFLEELIDRGRDRAAEFLEGR